MEAKLKHLEMIQGVINRMAHNSFLLKGWSVLLVVGLFALAAPDKTPQFVYLAYLPVLVFWGLDGYFLRIERLYRKLYDDVSKKKEEEIDFSMNSSVFNENVDSWLKVTLSSTLLSFHGIMLTTVIVVTLLLLNKCTA